METDRVAFLNEAPVNGEGRYVLYWMQQSQRPQFNPVLEHAVARAIALELPLLVVFGLYAGYPEANERHFAFMLEGLAEVAAGLQERGIRFVVRMARPDEACLALAPRAWTSTARSAGCSGFVAAAPRPTIRTETPP